MIDRLKPAELARELGVSRQAIHDLQERGILPRSEDGLIALAEAHAAIANNIHPGGKTAARLPADVPAPQQPEQKIDFQTARTLREFTEAKRAVIKLRIEQGDLAPIADVDRMLRSAVLNAREFLRAEPKRLAVLLEGLDRGAREALLVKTFDEFLIRLSEWRAEENAEPD